MGSRAPAHGDVDENGSDRAPFEIFEHLPVQRDGREDTPVERWEAPAGEVPRCTHCGAPLRPDVVWFEEMLPQHAVAAAEDAVRRCDVLLVVGTSAEVYPAAALPAHAQRSGAIVVEINPNTTALSAAADHVLRGAAGAVLPALVAALD